MSTWLRWLAVGSSFALLNFVGGLGFAIFGLSVIAVACLLGQTSHFNGSRAVLASVVVNFSWLYLFVSMVLPRVRDIGGLGRLFVQPLVQNGFHATTYPDNALQISQLGAIIMLGFPALATAVMIWRRRRQKKLIEYAGLDWVSWVATLLPVVLAAVLKAVDPWRFAVFATSGDGRNHFVMIEQIRVQAGTVPSPFELTTPKLPNAIASLLSAANGSIGTLQRGDLWGMATVWVLSAVVIALSCSVAFMYAARQPEKQQVPVVVGTVVVIASFMLATNSFLVSTSLTDGFFSLYFGSAILAALLVLAVTTDVTITSTVLLAIGLIGLIGGYTFLAPVFAGVLVAKCAVLLWRSTTGSRRTFIFMAVTAALGVIGILATIRSWTSFVYTATLSGAIVPIQSDVLYLCLLGCIGLVAIYGGSVGRVGWVGLVAVLGGFLTLYAIEHLSGNRAPGNSYYGSKTIVGTASAIAVLAFFGAGRSLAVNGTGRRRRVRGSLAAIALTLLPFAALEQASQLEPPLEKIASGWTIPNSKTLKHVVDRWGEPPYLFFRFATYPPGTQYFSSSVDRLLNFWSPVSWDGNSSWSGVYAWAYLRMVSLETSVLCEPIAAGVQTIYTSDPILATDVRNTCGTTGVKIVQLSSP